MWAHVCIQTYTCMHVVMNMMDCHSISIHPSSLGLPAGAKKLKLYFPDSLSVRARVLGVTWVQPIEKLT